MPGSIRSSRTTSKRLLRERGQAALPVARDRDVDLVLAEILRHQRAQAGVVVDEERGRPRRGGRLHGMWCP